MITAFTGLPGAGKTLSMTMQAYDYWLLTNCPVYSNYNIRFPYPVDKKQYNVKYDFGLFPLHWDKTWYSKPQEYYYPKILYGADFLEAFKQVDEALFLVDEAGTVFDNRSWRTFQKWMMARFRESRKSKLEIMYTAQNIGDVDLKLRQLTNFMVKCEFVKMPIFGFDLILKNPKYHADVIKSDTQFTRKEFSAGNITYIWKQFKKFYKFYNTYERIVYDIPKGKELINLLKKNKFETGEYR